MIATPYLTTTQEQLTAVIPFIIPKDEIQEVMRPGLAELMATLETQGIVPAGPWFNHHLKITPEQWEFEIGVPLSKPVVAAGRVRPSRWPAQRAARAVYHGPYEGLGDAWGQLIDWIAAEGHTPASDLYECYLAGPESSPDPAQWRTEFTKPLMG